MKEFTYHGSIWLFVELTTVDGDSYLMEDIIAEYNEIRSQQETIVGDIQSDMSRYADRELTIDEAALTLARTRAMARQI
jgi:hypothetical protein